MSAQGYDASRPRSHHYVSQRLRLHYAVWGDESAPPVLLVHGIQDHCRTWDDLVAALTPGYQVIAPDLRGHGDSAWLIGAPYAWLDYVYDLHQLVVQRGLPKVRLVGHSLGGSLAALYAGAFPERIERLVLLEAIGLWPGWDDSQGTVARVRSWAAGVRSLAGRMPRRYPTLEDAAARMQRANPHLDATQALHLTRHGSHQNEDGTFSWKFDNYTHAPAPVGLATSELVEIWRSVTAPTLILNASDGFEHRIGHDGTADHFADAELAVVSDAGHWVHHDQLDEVMARVNGFIGDP